MSQNKRKHDVDHESEIISLLEADTRSARSRTVLVNDHLKHIKFMTEYMPEAGPEAELTLFIVNDVLVCWVKPLDDKQHTCFVSKHVTIDFKYNDFGELWVEWFRRTPNGVPPRGFAAKCLKECMKRAAIKYGATEVHLTACGHLVSDNAISALIEETNFMTDNERRYWLNERLVSYYERIGFENFGDMCMSINVSKI